MELCGLGEDLDRTCPYYSKKQVEVRDKFLGIIQCTMQTAMVTYIVLGIFIYNQGYLDYEPARGAIATHVHGDAVSAPISSSGVPSNPRYFSAEEITYPGLENGNVFVTTRLVSTRQERRGGSESCEDQTMPCGSDEDCHSQVSGMCGAKGFCVENSWCPQKESEEAYELSGVGDMSIWIKSSIQFVGLAPGKIWSTEKDHPYPEKGFNLFTLKELLSMVEPTPVQLEEVFKLGAAIEVQFIWNCHVADDKCKPEVKVRRLDILFGSEEERGYSFNRAEYITDDERLLSHVSGVRIFLRTVGNGHRLSIVKFVMKASTAGTLLTVAGLVTDLLMLQAFRFSKMYFARKYEVSPDFSEYMEKLEEKREHESRLPGMLSEDDRAAHERDADWQRRLGEHD